MVTQDFYRFLYDFYYLALVQSPKFSYFQYRESQLLIIQILLSRILLGKTIAPKIVLHQTENLKIQKRMLFRALLKSTEKKDKNNVHIYIILPEKDNILPANGGPVKFPMPWHSRNKP